MKQISLNHISFSQFFNDRVWYLFFFLFSLFLHWTEADLARSLLFAISNDIGQIASLYAMMHGLKKVLMSFIYNLTDLFYFCYITITQNIRFCFSLF